MQQTKIVEFYEEAPYVLYTSTEQFSRKEYLLIKR